jgi:multidrug efflux pump subunit AcrA (membrane-fusion protein)
MKREISILQRTIAATIAIVVLLMPFAWSGSPATADPVRAATQDVAWSASGDWSTRVLR